MSQLVPSPVTHSALSSTSLALHNVSGGTGLSEREQRFIEPPVSVPWSDLAALCNALGWTLEAAAELGWPVEQLNTCVSCGAVFDPELKRAFYSDECCAHCVRDAEEEVQVMMFVRNRERERIFALAQKQRRKERQAS